MKGLLLLNHPTEGMIARPHLEVPESLHLGQDWLSRHYSDKQVSTIHTGKAWWMVDGVQNSDITSVRPWPYAMYYEYPELIKLARGIPKWLLMWAQSNCFNFYAFECKDVVLMHTRMIFGMDEEDSVLEANQFGGLIFSMYHPQDWEKIHVGGYAVDLRPVFS